MQYGTSYGSTAPFDKGENTFKDIVLYNTKSGSPMITSQEPLLVLYSTIYFFRVLLLEKIMHIKTFIEKNTSG